MNFNEEIKQLVKSRRATLELEFEKIVKKCIEVFKQSNNNLKIYICCKNRCLGVTKRLNKDAIEVFCNVPLIDAIYMSEKIHEKETFSNFLKDFEYYLYKNTIFDFYENSISEFGQILCIELPILENMN